ncbi:radical SAM protein [Clostridium sp. K25]|uniref:elongator complex protein 3 n=1 Tax=Clostridium TaxID=1485 RepID=UPI0004D7E5F0|nr:MULTISPECIES: radical SAM protein [Clostridium]KEI10368.1 radical SAM protein [Clostridium sp. K25]MCD3244727.1 radical SAM protein [Clostridium botulinum C]MCD3261286.1 radical SAM protein [Clostridium botulinum C]
MKKETRHYIIPIFVPHEGCPHDCVFCNQNSITGSSSKVDGNFVKNTIEEYLKTINKENSIIEVSFFGGTFTAIDINKQNELLRVAKHYKDLGKIDYIHLSTRPDYIDNNILKNLKEYSADVIELGVQSLDDEVLLKSGRGHTVDDVVKASKLIKEYGFVLGLQVMLGLPGDNFEKDIYTAKKVIDLKPEIARIYPALVVKNTPMETMYINNKYKPYTLEEAIEVGQIVYSMLVANDINVIRVGLQPTEEINYGGELVAGPFHPAFRELIEGSIYNNILLEEIKKLNAEKIIVHINNKDISKLYAYKKKFFNAMISCVNTKKVIILQDKLIKRGNILIENDEKDIKISLKKTLQKKYKEGYLETL